MTLHFDLVDMRLFVQVARNSSLSRGASACNMSPPAASMRIRSLEAGLGQKLFNRSHNGVGLTPAGEIFLHHATAVVAEVEALRARFSGLAEGARGQLRIAANNIAMSEILPGCLRHYMKLWPDVRVDLKPKINAEVIRAVLDGEADIGLFAGQPDIEGLEVRACMEDCYVVVASPGHILARRQSVTFSEAIGHEIIGFPENSGVHAFMRQMAGNRNAVPNVKIMVDNHETMLRMIEADVAIGIVPKSLARRHASRSGIRIIELSDPEAVRHMWVGCRSFADLPEYARNFVERLDMAPVATA